MKKIIQARWFLLILWIAAAILLTAFKPDVNAIIRERGQSALSDDSASVKASKLLDKMDTTKGSNDLIVFYDKKGLSDSDKSLIKSAVERLDQSSNSLGITEMIDPFSMPDAADSLYSKDGTTLMVSVKVDRGDKSVDTLKEQFEQRLDKTEVSYYLSGEDFINNDYQTKSENGVQKSAILTVLFILIVLIIVFRSVITPVVSLIGVAVAYLTASGISAFVIDRADFPATSLTTMLMVLILFGIGTDYNILLFNRFREELSRQIPVDDAIINTYKTAGKTIVYSIMTVIIAFATLVLANCPIYKSGAVVVIGALMLMLEILTLTPFVMKTLGNRLFWPAKTVNSHKVSITWGILSKISSKYAFAAFVLILAVIAPITMSYKETLSFNLVGELGDSTPSSKGFNLVAKHYGAGQMMTTSVVIANDQAMDNNKSMAVIDALTQNLKKIDGVKKVSSITQPEGRKIDAFYLGSQLSSVADGLAQSNSGLTQISQGMQTAQQATGSNQMESVISGLNQISGGLDQTKAFLADLSDSTTFNMPEQALKSDDFQPALKAFFNDDRKITKLTVVLNDDPYSQAAQDTVKKIRNVLKSTLQGTSLAKAEYGVAGTTASTSDTNEILSSDLQRTAVIVIIGVFCVLLFVVRSIWTSIAIVGSLVGAYFVGATAMNQIFMQGKGLEGISSFVPFFVFIVIIALGVDYSIFLMMRFRENSYLPIREAIVRSCKQIGGVVMSAIVILGGTFATLIPSGMTLLEELAVAVIAGLIALCFFLLPIFLPAAIMLPEKINRLFPVAEQEEDSLSISGTATGSSL